MEMQQLKYFKVVAEIGKISEAASALFISPPALSASISRLEKDLEISLFDRTNNRITLNQQGQIFLQGVNQMFSTLENTKEAMRRSLHQQGSRQLSLCMVSSTQWVALLAAYSQKHPEVTLSCVDVKRTDLELSGMPARHNFLLASQDDVPTAIAAELEQHVQMEDHPVIMVNARHPLAERTSVDIQELEKETLFLPMRGYPVWRCLKDMFLEAGMAFPEENAHSHLMAQQMAAKGLGIGFTSRCTITATGPELCCIPIRTPHRPWNLCLYRRREPVWLPEERAFVEFVKEYCANPI